jgi:hypothetical protein
MRDRLVSTGPELGIAVVAIEHGNKNQEYQRRRGIW